MATLSNLVVNIRAVVPDETRQTIWCIDWMFYRLDLALQRPAGLPSLRITM